MAAHLHGRSSSKSKVECNTADQLDLPKGTCNFKDLNGAIKPSTCGCRKFWLNTQSFNNGPGSNGERAWCFCGHHACFHNWTRPSTTSPAHAALEEPSGWPSRPGSNDSDPARAVVDVEQQQCVPATLGKQPTGLGLQLNGQSQSQSQSVSTRLWNALNGFARDQDDGGNSDTTSKLPSTAAPSIVGEQRVRPGRAGRTNSAQSRLMGPPVNVQSLYTPRPGAEEYLGSATEVNTPSMAGTPDFRAPASGSGQHRASPQPRRPPVNNPASSSQTKADPTHSAALPKQPVVERRGSEAKATASSSRMHSQVELQNIIQGYGSRLNILESLSFNHVGAEEVQEKFDLVDARLIDLEHWRLEQDEQHSGTEPPQRTRSSKRRRLLPTETSSFDSDGSFDSSAAAHAETAVLATLAANAETGPRIDALETRVLDLENTSLPSFTRPWQVEVVLLPWGRGLRGIWFSSAEASQRASVAALHESAEWTGSSSFSKVSLFACGGKAALGEGWTTDSIEAWADDAKDWLSPKACGPNGMVFQRLASRGLIRNVYLKTSDSRTILNVLSEAFATPLNLLSNTSAAQPNDTEHFQAFHERLVPLRKVRKSSRLRFLSPAEMVTSATWTAGFLDASVCMRLQDGHRRLYLTTPEAYLQNSAEAIDWTKLHALPRHNDDMVSQQAQYIDDDGGEACWAHHDRLDLPASVHSSFASHVSHDSHCSTRSQASGPDEEKRGHPISPTSELPLQRLPTQRTVSLPSSSSANSQAREALQKRRVASFEQRATTAADSPQTAAAPTRAKRRRISTSPGAERRGLDFTPRWSREPPSPFMSDAQLEPRSQATANPVRGSTPLAYATPHSNSNFAARVEFANDGGDTEADTEIAGAQSERAEDEWHGVEEEEEEEEAEAEEEMEDMTDGRRTHGAATDDGSGVDGLDVDGDSLDGG